MAKLTGIQPSVEVVCDICRQLDENFDIEETSVDELRQDSISLDEDCREQINRVKALVEQ